MHKEDCYFYVEVQDMGGRIPTCNYIQELGKCPCLNCKKYIARKDVYQLIKNIVDKEDKNNG